MTTETEYGTEQVVIHNPEQQSIMNLLTQLVSEGNEAIEEIRDESYENESLAKIQVEWGDLRVYQARRWIDADGNLGYLVYVEGTDDPRFLTALCDKIKNRGWEGTEVSAQ